MEWTWVEGRTTVRRCPLCASEGPHPAIVHYRVPYRDHSSRDLLRCHGCRSMFLDDLSEPPPILDSPDICHHINFYVELAAGIDEMAQLFYRVDVTGVHDYLEIGCGFGFTLDFARRVFGWRVTGIDPGVIAQAGKRMLDLDISSDYVSPGYDFGGRRFDLVMCSEVIEHVADPASFLDAVKGALRADGALVLTTPNADYVRTDTPLGVLLPILQPGFHLVLFTTSSLERALREAGFPHVEVWQSGAGLHAVAAFRPIALNHGARTDPAHYRGYLWEFVASHGASTVAVGLAYRLLKHDTNAGDLKSAEAAFRRLSDLVRDVYRLDIGRPAALGLDRLPALGLDRLPALEFADVGAHMPFCLGCLLYYRGIGLMNGGRCDEAVEFLETAASAVLAVRLALHRVAMDDGDCETAWQQSRAHLPVALCHVDASRALDALAELAGPPPAGMASELWALPPPALRRARRETFVRLVKLGHYQAAGTILGAVAEDLGAATRSVGRPRPILNRLRRAIEAPVGERLAALPYVRRVARPGTDRRGSPGLFAVYDRAVEATQTSQAFGAAGAAAPAMPPARDGEHVECPPEGPVTHVRLHRRLTYRLIAERQRWRGLDVLIGTHRQAASGRFELTVWSSGGNEIRRVTVDLASARDNKWLRFEFEPIENSRGSRFVLRFALIDRGGSRLSLYDSTAAGTSLIHRLIRRLGLDLPRESLYCCTRYAASRAESSRGA